MSIATVNIDRYHLPINVSADTLRGVLAIGVVGLLGALVTFMPAAAMLLVLLLYVSLRGKYLFQDTLVMLLAGNLILNYGFANVGLKGVLPIPITDGVLMMLVCWCVVYSKSLQGLGTPGFFLIAVITLACARLASDYYTYGNLAIRDFTTPVETTFVVVGYWAMQQYGLQWAWRVWTGVCLAVAAYALLFPFIPQAGIGPTVGLQQPVPLISPNVGAASAVIAALFLFLLRFKSPWSWLFGAVCLAEVGIMQLKGLYLGLPLVTLALAMAGGQLKTGMTRRLGASLLFGVVMLTVCAPFIPSGRLGAVSLSFVGKQFAGMFSGKGDDGGQSVTDRLEWQKNAWHQQSKSVGSMVWGLGLGKDLTEGFEAGGTASVRKPHNDYIEITARYGFLGLALWLGLIGSLVVPVWRGVRSELLSQDERRFLLWVLAFSLTSLFVAGTQPLLAYPYGTIGVFVPLGMGLAVVRRKERAALETATADALETAA
jgi:O-antigen ligase